MRIIVAAAGSLALLLLSGESALAQDFNGARIGLQGGWELTEGRSPEDDLGQRALEDDRGTATGGFFIGYDRQLAPRIVVGVEGGMDFSTGDAVEGMGAGQIVRMDPEWSLDLTTRAGYLVDPGTLAYLRGGYTNARVETTATSGAARLTDADSRAGWLLGAGIERLLPHDISGRLEYRYSELSEGDDAHDRHRILAGIAFRF